MGHASLRRSLLESVCDGERKVKGAKGTNVRLDSGLLVETLDELGISSASSNQLVLRSNCPQREPVSYETRRPPGENTKFTRVVRSHHRACRPGLLSPHDDLQQVSTESCLAPACHSELRNGCEDRILHRTHMELRVWYCTMCKLRDRVRPFGGHWILCKGLMPMHGAAMMLSRPAARH